jgi:exonuclease SbcC
MILRRLFLTNFRQYEKLDITFRDGITGIVGRNGSGKTTILEAVLWCLFGNRAARTSKEGIRRQSVSVADPCLVELSFGIGETEYLLKRSLTGKSNRSEARLTRQGSLDAVSTREVDDYVVKLIGLDLKAFLSSFFARQKELNALTDARPADRKDHLAKMLGVGRLDDTIQLLKEDIKSVRQRIGILNGLQIDPAVITDELSAKRSEIESLGKSKAGQNENLTRIEAEIQRKNKDLEELRAKELENNRLEKKVSAGAAQQEAKTGEIDRLTAELAELDQLTGRLEILRDRIRGIDELKEGVSKLQKAENLSREKTRLENELKRLSDLAETRLTEKQEIQKQIAEMEKVLEAKKGLIENRSEKETGLERYRNEYREITAELRVITRDLEKLEKQKSEIQNLGPDAVCEFCLRPFGEEFETIEEHFDRELFSLGQRAEPMKARLVEVDKDGKMLNGQLEHIKNQLEKLDRLERDLASSRTSLKAVEAGIGESETGKGEIGKRLAEIGEVVFDPDKLSKMENELRLKQKEREEYIRLAERLARRGTLEADLDSAKEDLGRIETGLNELKAEIKAIGFDRQVFQQAQAEMDKIRSRVADIKVGIERVEGRIALLESEIKSLRQKLDDYEKSKKEISRLREELTSLERLSILFAEFRVYLIGRIRPALSKQTSQLFYEMTGGRYQEVELDEDYNLRLYDNGEKFSVVRFSGGEIDLVNLCFRLAISLEMAAAAGIDRSFIILDEIFGSQDIERQQLIIEGLNRLKNRFQQIILISHIEEVKGMTEHVISVERDSSGISRAIASGGE